MNEHLRDRVLRKLDTLSDERAYQVLDYVEFLESKYAERQATPTSIFARFSEAVEDRLRAGKVSASAIAETMSLMSRAMNVLNGVATGVAAAGRSVASDFERAAAARSGASTGTPTSSTASPRTSGATSGPAVAGSGRAESTPPAPPPPSAPGQPPSGEASATESGELDAPPGR
jgi:hypothetical protein